MSTTVPRWYLYMLETAGGALYTGITTNVSRRLAQHEAGRGAKALRGRGPLVLRHQEPVGSQGEALRLEAEVKRLSAVRKRAWLKARQLQLGLSSVDNKEHGDNKELPCTPS